tara:strand:+ start:219 stop:626 length:408 start_codon:yes stop_codon:yes gene_type:complete
VVDANIPNKNQGTVHELAVAKHLVELGATVCWPVGDNAGFDLVCDWRGKLGRLQVKGSESLVRGSYRVHLTRGQGRRVAYTKNECDALVACCPLGFWVIPIAKVDRAVLIAWPGIKQGKRPHYDIYKDNWKVLRG